ncbi:MAG: hypothetical protein DMG56_27170 [Acidobacteria bacterium]|nr:MAG: hypothetical protein DMG56_27170 [Acidobacteriota bacterium]
MLQLRYANGTKERYWRLPKKDGKKAPTILEAVLPLSRSEATPAQGFLSICPDCRAALTAGNYQCSICRLKFTLNKALEYIHSPREIRSVVPLKKP